MRIHHQQPDTPRKALMRQIENLEAKLQDHMELFDHLKSLPEPGAFELLRQLDTVSDLPVLLASVKGGSHGQKRPSTLVAARSVSPPTQTGFEFELIALHSVVYPALMPIDVASIALTPIVQRGVHQPNHPKDRSSATHASTADYNILSSIQSAPPSGSSPTPWRETRPLRGVGQCRVSTLAGPSRPSLYVDERLQSLHIRYWTKVPIGDEFAAAVLSSYLELDHPVLGSFDADLFLVDLVDHRLRFCSSFLFSSLMGYACVSFQVIRFLIGL